MNKQPVSTEIEELRNWHEEFHGMSKEDVIKVVSDLPDGSVLKREWTGYEDLTSWVEIQREETDEEYRIRLAEEKVRAEIEKERKRLAKERKDAVAKIKKLEEEIRTIRSIIHD